MAFVSQEPQLFSSSIADNIARGDTSRILADVGAVVVVVVVAVVVVVVVVVVLVVVVIVVVVVILVLVLVVTPA